MMRNLSIAEMFRYLFPAVFAFSLLFISDETFAICLLKKIEVVNAILIALVLGSLFYAVYKSLIYPKIEYLQDFIRGRKLCIFKWYILKIGDNWRTYLMSEYSLNKDEAKKLFIIIRRNRGERSWLVASQIHFLYMASIISLFFIAFSVSYGWDNLSVIIIIFIITFISGLSSDRFFEEVELAFIKQAIKDSKEYRKIDKLIESVKMKDNQK